MLTLALDASTYTGSVALFRDDRLIAERSVAMRDRAHERLMPAVAEALAQAGVEARALGRIVCGGGPGSFTSLRIAGAIAKGLATGSGAPLHAVPSLGLLAAASKLGPGRYLAVLDALRGECYVGSYALEVDRSVRELGPARVIAAAEVDVLARSVGATVIGPAHGEPTVPHARAALALLAGGVGRVPVDLAGWEPAYGRLAEAQVRWEATHGRSLAGG